MVWRLLQRSAGEPKTAYVVGAIVISSLVFGLIAGYLYWKRGLESAVLAHMLAEGTHD